MKPMLIRNVPSTTKKRLKILKEIQEHKNIAETLTFLLDFYNKNHKEKKEDI
jgi:plasmid stability protein